MNRSAVIIEFKKMVNEISKNIDYRCVFKKLQQINLSRTEMMIVDSAIKNMPLDNLDKTLLLSSKSYDKTLQYLTFKLNELHQSETLI